MAKCLDKNQLDIIRDSLEDFKVNIAKAMDEESDPATIELYEDVLENAEKAENTVNSLSCRAMR